MCQYCLGNALNRGAWLAIVHGVTKSQIWLNDWTHTHTHTHTHTEFINQISSGNQQGDEEVTFGRVCLQILGNCTREIKFADFNLRASKQVIIPALFHEVINWCSCHCFQRKPHTVKLHYSDGTWTHSFWLKRELKPTVFWLKPHTQPQDLLKSLHRKNSVIGKVTGKEWVY